MVPSASRLIVALTLLVANLLVGLPTTVDAALKACKDLNITRCTAETQSADVLFLVDGSETMYRDFFYGQMLDYVQQLQCTLNGSLPNRSGMLIFNSKINMVIPLDQYSEEQWVEQVEAVRADQSNCCKCCTPLAEAFDAARLEFQRRGANPTKIVVVITDGDPVQNDQNTIEDPVFNKYLWDYKTFDEAVYTYRTVPRSANLLKAAGAKIILLGVPNRQLQRINIPYFLGRQDPTRNPKLFGQPNPTGDYQCVYRNNYNRAKCGRMLLKGQFAFPITSHAYDGESFEPTILLELTTPEFCRPLDTPKPTTLAPTRRPSTSPTNFPTTLGPSFLPTRSPTLRPTHQPSASPTTSRPSRAPKTSGPSFSPSRAPVSSGPTKSPTTSIPTKSPTSSAPTRSPSNGPTEPRMKGLDMFVILDRSKSLTYGGQASVCRAADGGNKADGNDLACWRLFVGFTKILADKLQLLRNIGWKGDRRDRTEGLRMTIIAFWCTNQQTVPQSHWIGQNIETQADFDAAMDAAMLMRPDFGTCPGDAIEKVVMNVQNNEVIIRPYKSAVLLSDGVMYDMPVPKLAAEGLKYFGVMSYALGIAMVKTKDFAFGLTPAEALRQKNQLRHFVGGNESRVFNFGEEGYNLLPTVANQIATYLDRDLFGSDQQTYWCGYTNKDRCVGPPGTGNGYYCKWMNNDGKWPGGNAYACKEKGYCEWNQATCKADSYCRWDVDKCVPKSQFGGFVTTSAATTEAQVEHDDDYSAPTIDEESGGLARPVNINNTNDGNEEEYEDYAESEPDKYEYEYEADS